MIKNASKHKKGGRPRKEIKRCRVNITLDPEIHKLGSQIAFNSGRSFSNFVEICLRDRVTQIQSDPHGGKRLLPDEKN